MLRTFTIAAAMALAAEACGGAGPADPPRGSLTTSGDLYGEPAPDGDPRGKHANDVSGLACAPESAGARIFLIVDDESQGAQIVVLRAGTLIAGDPIRLTQASFAGKPLELDAEAVAWADGAFYIIGSHGRRRHEKADADKEQKNIARAEATRMLYRVRLPVGGVDRATGRLTGRAIVTASRSLRSIILAQPALAPAYDQALIEGGLTIEGLAVRAGTAFVGFRGPVSGGRAAVVAVPLARLFGASAGPPARLLPVELGPDSADRARGVRDLVAINGGFVGIAGPVQDPLDDAPAIRAGDYALFWWTVDRPPVVRALGPYPAKTKPEGLMPLAFAGGRLRALLMFDGPADGGPVEVQADFAGPR